MYAQATGLQARAINALLCNSMSVPVEVEFIVEGSVPGAHTGAVIYYSPVLLAPGDLGWTVLAPDFVNGQQTYFAFNQILPGGLHYFYGEVTHIASSTLWESNIEIVSVLAAAPAITLTPSGILNQLQGIICEGGTIVIDAEVDWPELLDPAGAEATWEWINNGTPVSSGAHDFSAPAPHTGNFTNLPIGNYTFDFTLTLVDRNGEPAPTCDVTDFVTVEVVAPPDILSITPDVTTICKHDGDNLTIEVEGDFNNVQDYDYEYILYIDGIPFVLLLQVVNWAVL